MFNPGVSAFPDWVELGMARWKQCHDTCLAALT